MKNLTGIIVASVILVSLAFIVGIFWQDILLLGLGLIAVVLLVLKYHDDRYR